MNTISITSQGQITIPAAIRRQWADSGSNKLDYVFDEEAQTLILRPKPKVEQVLAFLRTIPHDRDVPPLQDIHKYYEAGRTEELIHDA